MAKSKGITQWLVRTRLLITDQGLVRDALADPVRFSVLMGRHRRSSCSYLDWLLIHHRLVIDAEERKEAIRRIWEGVVASMPDRLATRWSKGNTSLRELLCEAIHESCYEWQKIITYTPGTCGLASPVAANDAELLRRQRADVLEKARERLRLDDQKTKTRRYLAFITWEADKEASHQALNTAMARQAGCRPLDPQDFRQTLVRACDRFGRYLAEEVEALFIESDRLNVEKFRNAFERLDLIEDYALKSKHCRLLLELSGDA